MPDPNPPAPPAPPRSDPGTPDLAAQIARLMKREGGSEQALELVLTENREYRERHRQDGIEITQLRSQVPAKDTVVLTADQAKQWEGFQALKLAPDKITEGLKKVETLTAENETLKAQGTFAEAGTALKYKPKVLETLLRQNNMVIENKDILVQIADGKTETRSVPHVRPKDKDASALVPLKDYAEKDLKDWMPSLKADASTTTEEGGGGNNGQPTEGFTFVPQQSGGGKDRPPQTTPEAVSAVLSSQFMSPSERAKADKQ